MNKWFKIALVSLIGLIISSLALNFVTPSASNTSNQSMNMGQMQNGFGYGYEQNGRNFGRQQMQNRMNFAQTRIQNAIRFDQQQMQNGMNLGQNMAQNGMR